MNLSRRELMAGAGASLLSVATGHASTQRFYVANTPGWWTNPLPVVDWPQDRTNGMAFPLSSEPDRVTSWDAGGNWPFLNEFQAFMVYLVTPPLVGRPLITGSMDGMVFGVTGSRKLAAYVTTQALVMSLKGEIRGVLSDLTIGTTPFPFYIYRALRLENELGLPIELNQVQAEDGDVIAVALGMTGDNRTKSMIYALQYHMYANCPTDVIVEGTRTPGNTWIEFSLSQPLLFRE